MSGFLWLSPVGTTLGKPYTASGAKQVERNWPCIKPKPFQFNPWQGTERVSVLPTVSSRSAVWQCTAPLPLMPLWRVQFYLSKLQNVQVDVCVFMHVFTPTSLNVYIVHDVTLLCTSDFCHLFPFICPIQFLCCQNKLHVQRMHWHVYLRL